MPDMSPSKPARKLSGPDTFFSATLAESDPEIAGAIAQ